MKALSKIIGALIAIIGTLSAIKTLAPAEITYLDLFKSSLFISGWVFSSILAIVIIYQEEKNRQQKKQIESTLSERGSDKAYLQSELSKSNISLNHLTSRFSITENPIPKGKKEGEDNGFQ